MTNHKHLIVNAYVNKPFETEQEVTDWLNRVVQAVDMHIFMEARARYCYTEGNEGITGDVVIETSHATIHIWNKLERPRVSFDLYSCKDFNEAVVIALLDEMTYTEVQWMTIDRNDGLEVINRDHVYRIG